jgi:hypothetical protein
MTNEQKRIAYLEALIRKYANHVLGCEGSNFLADRHRKDKDRSGITDEEWADLVRIAGTLE